MVAEGYDDGGNGADDVYPFCFCIEGKIEIIIVTNIIVFIFIVFNCLI